LGALMEQNKSYLGYKPKDNNLVKLAQYLHVKNADKTANNANNNKMTTLLTKNSPLKNKRF
jgi:hypothetical protein